MRNCSRILDEIKHELNYYRCSVDGLAAVHKKERETHDIELAEMQGKYTKEYIDEVKRTWQPSQLDYAAEIKKVRDKSYGKCSYLLERIQKKLDSYFNAPVSPEFATKITSVKTMGLQLSDREFALLQDDAKSYLELRLLNQLAWSRTEPGEDAFINDKGEVEGRQTEKSIPYLHVKLPDIDGTYKAFDSIKNAVDTAFTSYCGKDYEMQDIVFRTKDLNQEEVAKKMKAGYGVDIDGTMKMNELDIAHMTHAEKCLRDDYDSYVKFEKIIDDAWHVLPEGKRKTSLTDKEKNLIDVLIDSQYPSLAQSRAVELAKNSQEIADLLLLDERYSEKVGKALESEVD